MTLSREQIVSKLGNLVAQQQIVTDEQILKDSSVDRFRKFEAFHGVYTQPMPAAIVYVSNTNETAKVLEFAHQNKINVVPRTGGSATEGGLETALENSIVLDGSMMNKIIEIDTYNMLATVQCGTSLQELDDQLRLHWSLSSIKAASTIWWSGCNAQHRAVLHPLRWYRRYGNRFGSGFPRRWHYSN